MVKELTGKKLLKACRQEKKEIIILEQRKEQIMSMLLPKAITPKEVYVQESREMDPMAEKMAAAEMVQKEIDKQIAVMLGHELKARRMIEKLKDSKHRQLLSLYYLSNRDGDYPGQIKLYTWEAVAEEMNYDVRSIIRLWHKAIENIEKCH